MIRKIFFKSYHYIQINIIQIKAGLLMNTNAQKKSLRNSRVELLRIISMILIVAFHATRMGCIETSQPFYIYFSGIVLGSWGILGVDIFVIISSYFLVDQNFKSQRLINIAFQTFTYLFLYFVLSFILWLIPRTSG